MATWSTPVQVHVSGASFSRCLIRPAGEAAAFIAQDLRVISIQVGDQATAAIDSTNEFMWYDWKRVLQLLETSLDWFERSP